MIKNSKKISTIFENLYFSERATCGAPYQFEQIMASNKSRLEYLNELLEKLRYKELSKETKRLLLENIEFIHSFINGKFNKSFSVPKKYYLDKDECSIVPTDTELDHLFHLIEANKTMFDLLYKGKKYTIELPKNSFNQNMVRVLQIQEYNLAHLLGLTDSEQEHDSNKNQLKKYFLKNVKNQAQYGEKESERLLNWILSEEGKEEIKRLNNITLEYIKEDKRKHPDNYDENGNIKPKSYKRFKERYKKDTGYDYPLIKYSRYITKCINTLNFLNMNNTHQMILDYNAPQGRKDEKDIFIVNSPAKELNDNICRYMNLQEEILNLLKKYAKETKEIPKERYKRQLEDLGVNINDKDIASYINLVETNLLSEENTINPNLEVFYEKIRNIIINQFEYNIHLIGFGTDLEEEIPLAVETRNLSHCDTSITVTPADLVGEFYERGRAFFLDKVMSESSGKIIRLSTPKEEIDFLEAMELVGKDTYQETKELLEELILFEENYRKVIKEAKEIDMLYSEKEGPERTL